MTHEPACGERSSYYRLHRNTRSISDQTELAVSAYKTYPLTFELFLPGCLDSWEEAGSRGSAGWSASWLDAAPPGAGPEDGEAELAFRVFCKFDT